jgi:hypothetical protein
MSTQSMGTDDPLVKAKRQKVYEAYKACRTATMRCVNAQDDLVCAMREAAKLAAPPFNLDESEEDLMFRVVNITTAIGGFPMAVQRMIKTIDNFVRAIKELGEPSTVWGTSLQTMENLRFRFTGRRFGEDTQMDEEATQEATGGIYIPNSLELKLDRSLTGGERLQNLLSMRRSARQDWCSKRRPGTGSRWRSRNETTERDYTKVRH